MIGAPMAGGPSTPQLAAALARAGAVGFLAGGMRAADALVQDHRTAVDLAGGTDPLIGVNLFVPEPANTAIPAGRRAPDSADRRARAAALADYRESLEGAAQQWGVELAPADSLNPDALDDWPQKLEAAGAESWPWVTFTFGLPEAEVLQHLRENGTVVGVTVTNVQEATAALEHGAQTLVVQGPEAGGHRSTHDPAVDPGTITLVELLAQVRGAVGKDVPLVAAGGLMDAEAIRTVLRAGAVAVQCGTAFLRSEEAGTSAVHRRALEQCAAGEGFPTTALTRAFSGRWARGLQNAFMQDHPQAPAAYPEVNVLTGPIRRAAAEAQDPQAVSLWAGTGAALAHAGPAEQILRRLTP